MASAYPPQGMGAGRRVVCVGAGPLCDTNSVKGTLSTLEDEGGGHVEGHCLPDWAQAMWSCRSAQERAWWKTGLTMCGGGGEGAHLTTGVRLHPRGSWLTSWVRLCPSSNIR